MKPRALIPLALVIILAGWRSAPVYNVLDAPIGHQDSSHLKYDGSSMHGNYNGWVQHLDTAIETQLTLI